MNRATIGGVMDYARLSQQHKPASQSALQAEVRRLAATGLTVRDISEALCLPTETMLELLREVQP